MILYFTGTGNSAFIAKRIAEKTGDTAVDVFPMIREHDYGKLSSRRPFVVVCPTYGWQIPHVERAVPQADGIAERIGKGTRLPETEITPADRFLSTVVNPVFYKLLVRAGKFRTTESCTGCGACVKLCPMSNIRLEGGSPVWGSDCTHCMACICRCPEEAIEYGRISVGKPRYRCPGAGDGSGNS